MSMVPMVLRDWWDDFELPRSRMWDNSNFGLGMHREDLIRAHGNLMRPYRRGQNVIVHPIQTETSKDENVFNAVLDVSQFTPAELCVKVSSFSTLLLAFH
jgi:hypothetical protein